MFGFMCAGIERRDLYMVGKPSLYLAVFLALDISVLLFPLVA